VVIKPRRDTGAAPVPSSASHALKRLTFLWGSFVRHTACSTRKPETHIPARCER